MDLRITEAGSHRLVFSGDIGRSGLPIIRDPEPPSGPIDTLIVESTYADRDHESVADAEKRAWARRCERVAARGGKILIPAFALGRCRSSSTRSTSSGARRKIPEIPIYVDSPLAVDITTVFRMHPDVFDHRERLVTAESQLFDFPLVRYVRDVADSKALNSRNGPAMIIAASGMAESGRILHHLANRIGDHRNLVLFVGFQAEHTLGRRIQEGADPVRIFGEEYAVRAEVETIGGYSAHADRNELRRWVRRLGGPIKRAFVVHGEPGALEAMAKLLRGAGMRDVRVPQARRDLRAMTAAGPGGGESAGPSPCRAAARFVRSWAGPVRGRPGVHRGARRGPRHQPARRAPRRRTPSSCSARRSTTGGPRPCCGRG